MILEIRVVVNAYEQQYIKYIANLFNILSKNIKDVIYIKETSLSSMDTFIRQLNNKWIKKEDIVCSINSVKGFILQQKVKGILLISIDKQLYLRLLCVDKFCKDIDIPLQSIKLIRRLIPDSKTNSYGVGFTVQLDNIGKYLVELKHLTNTSDVDTNYTNNLIAK